MNPAKAGMPAAVDRSAVGTPGTGEHMAPQACADPVICLENLCKKFASAPPHAPPALENVSAVVPSGMVVGLVGPDAAGKTTLMRLLAGLLLPSSGTVRVLGREPDNSGGTGIRDVGYMPQRFGLYEDLSVFDNLSLHAELRGLEGQAREAMFEKLLSFTDLKPFTRRLAGKLSGGMKQKLGLACALLTTPKVLLLDEPGVGVDPLSRRELWHMVGELSGNGMSVLWSTAYMDEAERCPHVLMLEHGRLVFEGAPQDFTNRVRGRVFQYTPPVGQARQELALWSQKKAVRDALIQGSRLRLVLEPGATPQGLADTTLDQVMEVPPRLEDAYIDAVGGMDHALSPFAKGIGVVAQPDTRGIQHSNVSGLVSPAPPVIRAVGLTKRFGTFVAASDISFDVRPGQIFGLLGPNGAGKSTTFRMLCGLSKPTEGNCFVAGINLLQAPGSARAQLGYMAQKFSLYDELTVWQNMRLVADLYSLPKAVRQTRMHERLETLGLGDFQSVKAQALPLGHKQRLAMACATLHNPPVLFLDEPTSGVDPRTRREFWKHINAMTQNGVAVLVTTHFMEEAEYCDEIALIFKGLMIAKGTPDELKTGSPRQTASSLGAANTPLSTQTLEEAFIAYIEAQRE